MRDAQTRHHPLILGEERQRQQGNALKVLALLQASPGCWVSWQTIAHVGGSCAWRTRIADARKIAKRTGGDVVWNRNVRSSAYRYLGQAPLGRDAGTPTTQPRLI